MLPFYLLESVRETLEGLWRPMGCVTLLMVIDSHVRPDMRVWAVARYWTTFDLELMLPV